MLNRILIKRRNKEYYLIYQPEHRNITKQGFVLEHRWIYEQYYRCCLLSWVHIHHLDNNGLDNKIENLTPLHKIKHAQITMKGKKNRRIDNNIRICKFCNKDNTYTTNKGQIKWYDKGTTCKKCYERIKYNRDKVK